MIHTDFERGFIGAEVIAYDDFVALGGEQGAKEAGRMRVEGKDYVVQDGDVCYSASTCDARGATTRRDSTRRAARAGATSPTSVTAAWAAPASPGVILTRSC